MHYCNPACLSRSQAKTVAEQLAAKLNTKLNYQPKEEEDEKVKEEEPETFRKYEEELEINDFPQQARWRVTSKVQFTFVCKMKNKVCSWSAFDLFINKTIFVFNFLFRKLWLRLVSTQKLASLFVEHFSLKEKHHLKMSVNSSLPLRAPMKWLS